MTLKDRGVPTVSEVIQELQEYPPDSHVLVYEELHEVEETRRQCNSGIRIVTDSGDDDSPEQIGFILTGY